MRHKKRHRKSILGKFFKLIFLFVLLAGGGLLAVKLGPSMLSGQMKSDSRFNVVLTSPAKTALLSLDMASGKAVIVDFPEDLYITQVAYGYGQYPIGKVFGVGELDKRGGKVLSDTIAMFLGIPVNGYVVLNDLSTKNLRASLASPDFILGTKTNVNLWDKLLLAKSLVDLRFDKIKLVNLGQKSEPLILADGSIAKVIVSEDLDNLLEGQFAEEKVAREGLRVQVVNTTDKAGLGNFFARIISGLGATVIDVSTLEKPLKECKIQGGEKMLGSATVGRLKEILGCELTKSDDTGRADVVVLLGQEQRKIFGN